MTITQPEPSNWLTPPEGAARAPAALRGGGRSMAPFSSPSRFKKIVIHQYRSSVTAKSCNSILKLRVGTLHELLFTSNLNGEHISSFKTPLSSHCVILVTQVLYASSQGTWSAETYRNLPRIFILLSVKLRNKVG